MDYSAQPEFGTDEWREWYQATLREEQRHERATLLLRVRKDAPEQWVAKLSSDLLYAMLKELEAHDKQQLWDELAVEEIKRDKRRAQMRAKFSPEPSPAGSPA